MSKYSLKQFLEKYSTIDSHFLNDFLCVFDNDGKINHEFNINLEKLATWLEVDFDKLKNTLIKSYIKYTDYIINEVPTLQKGCKKKVFFINGETFRKISMKSKSNKGNEVREYYIELEKMIDKYKDYLIEYFEGKTKKLLNNQKETPNPKKGVIYILKTDLSEDNIFKLGKSKSFKKRMENHNSSHADDIEILFIYEVDNITLMENTLKTI